jgi:hypothetical protein
MMRYLTLTGPVSCTARRQFNVAPEPREQKPSNGTTFHGEILG